MQSYGTTKRMTRNVGYAQLDRSIVESQLWEESKPISKVLAWIYIILFVAYRPSKWKARTKISGYLGYEKHPGEMLIYQSELIRDWGRSSEWIESFLDELNQKQMVYWAKDEYLFTRWVPLRTDQRTNEAPLDMGLHKHLIREGDPLYGIFILDESWWGLLER